MDDVNAQITAVTPTVIRRSPPVPENRPSDAARPEGETSRAESAAVFTAKTPAGEQLLLPLPAPKPPPQVEKIRRAADSSYEEKRALLAVLSSPAPEGNRAVDLRV